MNKSLITLVFAALSVLARADHDTAYTALRVFGKKFGDTALNRVVSVTGRNGTPQPAVWKVTAQDPAARAGLLEVEIQCGKVIAQRTPTARGAAAAMNFSQLNLDSDGVFTIANQEMQKQGVQFDRLDFHLRAPSASQPPIWHVDLFDRGTRVASFELAADSGAILERQISRELVPPPGSNSDRDFLVGKTPRREPAEDQERPDEWSRPGEPFRGVGDFFHRLGKRFERRGDQLKRFFDRD
jgi:hypothetical protein